MKRKVLISSILTIALCLSLIAGSTFALFTSESKVNVAVTSGKVNVVATATTPVIEWDSRLHEGVQMETNVSVKENVVTLDKLVPGVTVKFNIIVENNSDVTVLYRTIIEMVKDNGLWEGLKVTVNGQPFSGNTGAWTMLTPDQKTVATIPVVIEFPYESGNEYQAKSCSFAYTVEAVQGNANIADVSTVDALVEAMENGDEIYLSADLELTNDLTLTENTVIHGNGHTISGYPVWAGKNSVLTDIVFDVPVNGNSNASNLYCGGSITVENCTFKGTQWDAVQFTPKAGDTIVIRDCKFEAPSSAAGVTPKRFIHIEATPILTQNAVNIEISGNTFADASALVDDMIGLYYIDTSLVDFGGDNIFTNKSGDIYICEETAALAMTSDEAYAKFGHVGVSTATELRTALEKGGEYILLNDIDMKNVVWNELTVNNAVVLEGNGHTISNLNVRHYNNEAKNVQYGFGFISKADADVTIRNLTFTGADVGPEQSQIDAESGNIGGVVMGYSYKNTVLENVTVENSKVSGYGKLGCLIGYAPAGKVTLTGCTSRNNTIVGGTNLGGLIGTVSSSVTVTTNSCKVENITFTKVRANETLYTLLKDVPVTGELEGSTQHDNFTLKAGAVFNQNRNTYYYSYSAQFYNVITGGCGQATIDGTTYNFCEEVAVNG